jgi:hypothetical protein
VIVWLHERRKLSLFEKLARDVKVTPPITLNIAIAKAAMEAAEEYERAHLGVTVVAANLVDFDTLELQTVPNDMVDAMRYALPIVSPRSAVQISGI